MRPTLQTLAVAALTAVPFITVPLVAKAAPVLFGASGTGPTEVQAAVDGFRTSLGTLNSNIAGSAGSGRREVNWDGVPDAFSAPNAFPAGFFNSNSPRGVVFSTPGTGFQVSASASSGTAVKFGNLNSTYPTLFQTFSPQRLFTPLGSNVVDVSFLVPGVTTAALSRGFGAVFTDVDFQNTTSLSFFDGNGAPLGTYFVPQGTAANASLSFLGVDFGSNVVSRVRVTSGNTALGADETGGADLVVMDDFIYGEPVSASAAVPEPEALGLLGAGLLGLAVARRRRI